MRGIGAAVWTLLLFCSCAWSQSIPATEQRLAATEEAAAAPVPSVDSGVKPVATIPAGMHVAMRMISALDGSKLKNGEHFYMETRQPLALDARTVLPVKTPVLGVVETGADSGMEGAKGGVALRLKAFYSPDGAQLPASGRVLLPNHHAKARTGSHAAAHRGGRGPSMIGALAIAGGFVGGATAKTWRGVFVGGLIGAGAGVAIQSARGSSPFQIASGTDVDTVLDAPLDFRVLRVE
jgi:hypothetical protein